MKHLNEQVLLRLMNDVEQDKVFSNPFRYLLENWTQELGLDEECPIAPFEVKGRGQQFLDAANETYLGYVTEGHIGDLAMVYDLWSEMSSLATFPLATRSERKEKFLEFAEPLMTILAIGVPEKQLQELFWSLYEEHGYPKVVSRLAELASESEDEHEQKLRELDEARLNEEIQEQRGWDG
jgi:hypothetical protein